MNPILLYFLQITSLLILSINTFGQNQINSVVNNPNKPSQSNKIYAIVIGISDYLEYKDLKYADRDAQYFYEYLTSEIGPFVPKENILLLTNSEATFDNINIQLQNLNEKLKIGDELIIYFAGHGDYSKALHTNPGFLVCYNSSKTGVFISGNAIKLYELDNFTKTLVIDKKVRVIIILDMCHAGKFNFPLANQELSPLSKKLYRNAQEIRILSCQDYETSQEDSSFGGGRGVFSYFLLEGFYGNADLDNDNNISVFEIEKYLGENVPFAIEGYRQYPNIFGDKKETLFKLNKEILNKNKKETLKATQSIGYNTRGSQRSENIDSQTSLILSLFHKSIINKNFFHPKDSCTEYYFNFIKSNYTTLCDSLQLSRQYARALLDAVQIAINNLMASNPEEITLSKKRKLHSYNQYLKYLEKALDLLGENYFMYSKILSRKYFLEGYLSSLTTQNPNKDLATKCVSLFKTALNYDPNSSESYWQLTSVYGNLLYQKDSFEYYANKLIEIEPTWMYATSDISKIYMEIFKDYDKAYQILIQSLSADSNSIFILNRMGRYYHLKGNFKEAQKYLLKALSQDSNFIYALHNLGNAYLDSRQYAKAREIYEKIIKLDSTQHITIHNQGLISFLEKQYTQAIEYFNKSITLDSTFLPNYHYLGIIYSFNGNFIHAEYMLKKCIDLNPTNFMPYSDLFKLYLKSNRKQEALNNLYKCLELGPNSLYTLTNLGSYYFYIKNYELAKVVLNEVIKSDSNIFEPNYYLASIYSLQSKNRIAFKYLTKALRLQELSHSRIELKEDINFENLRRDKKRWAKLNIQY
ncbi:MAG: tetratricopeptide repeat protein [Saprospiraceae bacterium]|nr:tetratricopeptide repeat protein [Saprospiraceae bacterium]